MRVLGVDFGFSRIGLAVAETEMAIVSPRPAMAATGALKKDALAISEVAKKEEAMAIVVGVPLDEEGAGRMARICGTLAEHLRLNGHEVHTVDESMTSVTADATLREQGLKASERRKRRDGEAAALILERWMDGQS